MNKICTEPRGIRTSPRAKALVATEIFSNHFASPVVVEGTDVSVTGMFLSGDFLLEMGERLTLSFLVPGTFHRIVTDARIVRSVAHSSYGMGLRFDRLSSLDSDILKSAVARSLS
jgi:hypothetical protein